VFSIVITERGGSQRQLDFDLAELSIGRLDENEIVLPRGNVSKRHARIKLEDGEYLLLDLQSTNGTYINGRKVMGATPVVSGDKIYIGDFVLSLRDAAEQAFSTHAEASEPIDMSDEVAELEGEAAQTASLASTSPSATSLSATSLPMSPRRPPGRPPPVTRADVRGAPPRSGLAQPWALKNSSGRSLAPTAGQHGDVRPSGSSSANALSASLQAAAGAGSVEAEAAGAVATPERRAAGPTSAALRAAETARAAPISGEWPASNRPASVGPARAPDAEDTNASTSPAVLSPSLRLQGALQTLMERLAGYMDLTQAYESAFAADHQLTLERLLDELAREGMIAPDVDRRFLVQAAISEAVGLGPLDRLLNNRSVREVVVDGPVRILADLGGGLSPVSSFFSTAQAFEVALRRLCARAASGLNDEPLQEAWLPDGSLIQIIRAPLSVRGPLLSIRRAPKPAITIDQLVTEGVLSIEMLELLKRAMQLRLNILVVGEHGSGVSSLLAALASLSEEHERIVTLEDAPSLAIRHPHVLPLRASGAGALPLADLLRHVARLHADRLVIDDLNACNAPAALPAIAGLRGVLAGMHLHAASTADAVRQLESFALGHACPTTGPIVSAAFQLRLHVDNQGSGVRRVVGVTELRSSDSGELDLARLYRYEGGFLHTGRRASFVSRVEHDGSSVGPEVGQAAPRSSGAGGSDAPKGFLRG
jgi:pilus assembly protein CpaF